MQKLISAGEVAQLFRTPGLSESASAALKQQAHDAGLTSISQISMEVVRKGSAFSPQQPIAQRQISVLLSPRQRLDWLCVL